MVLSLPIRKQRLRIEKSAHGAIVHDTTRDYVHMLSEHAAEVLEQCDGTHSCGQIAQIVSEHSHLPYDRVAREVAHLVAEFADLALIESSRKD